MRVMERITKSIEYNLVRRDMELNTRVWNVEEAINVKLTKSNMSAARSWAESEEYLIINHEPEIIIFVVINFL